MEVPSLELVPLRKRRSLGTPLGADTNQDNESGDRSLRFWKKFKVVNQGALPVEGPVTGLTICPLHQNKQWAVAGSTRIDFLSLTEKQTLNSYTRFKDVIRCVEYRSDGMLLAATDDRGLVKVIDLSTRNPLRRYRGHTGPVYCCAFSRDKVHLLSGGDDTSLKLWNLSTPKDCILDIPSAHGDYIRCLAASRKENEPHVWASGSHDGTVKIWDMSSACSEGSGEVGEAVEGENANEAKALCTATINHGSPVNAITFFPSSSYLATAGGHFVKIWDAAEKPPRLIKSVQCHLKTITGVAVTDDELMLVTSSMDRTVKFHGLDDYTVRHSFDHEVPVCSLRLVHNEYSFAVGLSNGQWLLRRNPNHSLSPDRTDKGQPPAKRLYTPGNFWGRGANAQPSASDVLVTNVPIEKNTRLDRLLRTFQYQASLDFVVSEMSSQGAEGVHGLVEELIQRGALNVACRGRDEDTILPILAFVYANLGYGDRGTRRLVELTNALFDQNDWIFRSSDDRVKNLLQKISSKLSFELSAFAAFRELVGMMEIIRSSQTTLADEGC